MLAGIENLKDALRRRKKLAWGFCIVVSLATCSVATLYVNCLLNSFGERAKLERTSNERIQEPLDAVQIENLVEKSIEKRIQTLQQIVSQGFNANFGYKQCSGAFGNHDSRASMAAAGWILDVEDIEFAPPRLLAWSGGLTAGKMTAVFYNSGILTMKVSNPHTAPEEANKVEIWLNEELIVQLGGGMKEKICVVVRPGDTLIANEMYGKIGLRNIRLHCEAPVANVSAKPCVAGDIVAWKSRICNESEITWGTGSIDKVLNETRAHLNITKELTDQSRTAHKVDKQNIFHARDLYRKDNDGSWQVCGGFTFKGKQFSAAGVGVVLVSDGQFLDRYEAHIRSQKCYASWRGYDYWILRSGSYEICDDLVDNIFFEKHCMVAEFLKQRPPGYAVAVVDADVMPVVLDRGLEEWLSAPADIHFYERDIQNEIAAGNYIARNTPVTTDFLHGWARYKFKQPPGFSSADNGAIHIHLVETLQLVGHEQCGHMYGNLTAEVDNLNPYFAYVDCTLKLLGQARVWNLPKGGSIAIWPKLCFFVIDGVTLEQKANDIEGPIMHHGIKMKKEASAQYKSFDHCLLDKEKFNVQRGVLGQMAMGYAKSNPDQFKQGLCLGCPDTCLPTMSCQPLAYSEGEVPKRECGNKCSQ